MRNNSKIYYFLSTGNIIFKTVECEGPHLNKTTKEEDMKIYEQLKDKNIDEVDFIELEYGTSYILDTVKSYKINSETKELELTYYTQEELNAIQQQNQEAQALNNRVSDIANYLINDNTNLISSIEDSIIQSEINKLLN